MRSQPASPGARRQRRTRSRAPSPKAAGDRPSGTRSRTRRGASFAARPAMSRATTTTDGSPIWTSSPSSGLTAYRLSRCRGRGCSRTGTARSTRKVWPSTEGCWSRSGSAACVRSSRCTTGTCHSRSRTPAAGRSGPRRSGSPTTRTSRWPRWATRRRLDHTQRAVVLGLPRLRRGPPRAGPQQRRRRGRGRAPPQSGPRSGGDPDARAPARDCGSA